MRTPSRVVPVILGAILLAACSGDGSGSSTSIPPMSTAVSPSASTHAAEPVEAADFDPASFDSSAAVDNEWFPLTPGTQFVYRGSSLDDGKPLSHAVVFTVSDMVKEVNGVQAVVIWDRDYTEGELVEEEISSRRTTMGTFGTWGSIRRSSRTGSSTSRLAGSPARRERRRASR